MKSSCTSRTLRSGAILALSLILLAGCSSTPRHTNVLIFGTNTKLALDVSQDPAAGSGVSLGYKRQEMVWMPLLPNVNVDGLPAACTGTGTPADDCPKYRGNAGDDYDTYSVLASFGFDVSGSAGATGGSNGGGKIAQFFATGLAARALAKEGGAALVNTAELPFTPAQKADLAALNKSVADGRAGVIGAVVDLTDGSKIDSARRDALVNKAGANISSVANADFRAATTRREMEDALYRYSIDAAVLSRLLNP